MRYTIRSVDHEERINLTPMLDVVFIMLIFFIVTATFVKEAGLDLPASQDRAIPHRERASIFVRIGANDALTVADLSADVRNIRAHLERLHAQNPEASLIVQPSDDSTTDALVRVMDAAQLAGISDLSIAKP